jgi:hypothetical protein
VRVRRRREATPSTTLPTTREVARFTGGNVDANHARTRRTRHHDSPYQYRMSGLGNPSRSGHPSERRKNLSRAKRLIAVGAIGVASALIPATAASAGQSWGAVPLPQRGQSWGSKGQTWAKGQSWGSVLEGQSWGVVPETTPCGAANPPFWCGVVVPQHHHFWEFGLSFYGGESAMIGRTPIAGYGTGPVMPPRK